MTLEPVVLDTDVASLSLQSKLSPDVLRLLGGRVPFITFVTLAELRRWVEQRQWGAHRRELLARWLVGKHVFHSDDDVARTAASDVHPPPHPSCSTPFRVHPSKVSETLGFRG